MKALIRRAVPQDAEAIAAVHIQTWQVAYRGQLPDHYLNHLSLELERRAETWRTEISTPRSPKHEVWVANAEARLHGFVALGPARDLDPNVTGEVYAIYVHPNRWGQGVGRALFTHAASRLASFGYRAAILWVLESNIGAHRFYETAGWAVDGRTKVETGPDGIELREVSYRTQFRRENEEE